MTTQPTPSQATQYRSVLITGAGGYIGRQLVAALAANRGNLTTIVATDLQLVPEEQQLSGIEYLAADICSSELANAFERYKVEVVVHLAAVVTPGLKSDREIEYKVDVLGTENVLKASIAAGVKKFIYTSSGAAYGYHADNPEWLVENDALRGNVEFAYSHHKRLVEEDAGPLSGCASRAGTAHLQARFHPGCNHPQPDHQPVRAEAHRRAERRGQPLRHHLGPGCGRRHF